MSFSLMMTITILIVIQIKYLYWFLVQPVFKYLLLNSHTHTHTYTHKHARALAHLAVTPMTCNENSAYSTQCLQVDPARTERRCTGFTFPNKTKGPWISVRDRRFYNKDYAQYLTSNPHNPMDKELSCLHCTLTLTVK